MVSIQRTQMAEVVEIYDAMCIPLQNGSLKYGVYPA